MYMYIKFSEPQKISFYIHPTNDRFHISRQGCPISSLDKRLSLSDCPWGFGCCAPPNGGASELISSVAPGSMYNPTGI